MVEFNPKLAVQRYELEQFRSLPLSAKVVKSQIRIREWYEYWHGLVYVAFSGGKDSTVLAALVHDLYPDVPLVFNATGNEYQEIIRFVRATPGVTWLKPRYSVKEVFQKFGYPVVSKEQAYFIYQARHTRSDRLRAKRLGDSGFSVIKNKWRFLLDAPFEISDKCCYYLKKSPSVCYERATGRKPILGAMAIDSVLRKNSYLRNGCNMVSGRPRSWPMSFWTEDDVWDFIRAHGLPYSEIYDMGYERTGCVACGFGLHIHSPNRMQLLKSTHPRLWEYCISEKGLGMGTVLSYIGIPYE